MDRLLAEWQRLYLPDPAAPGLVDTDGRVRAAVIELARPARWDALSAVWRGVQADLDLPAPAIAVSGTNGLQLWFSFAAPVPAGEAATFVQRLRARYLPDVAEKRVRLMPDESAGSAQPLHTLRVPAEQATAGQWSAFVAADLAPVFEDTPWLDIPPGIDGQADVLARLQPMSIAALEAATARLSPPAVHAPAPAAASPSAVHLAPLGARAFLHQVMNDARVDMALRIQAAAALLPYDEPGTRPS